MRKVRIPVYVVRDVSRMRRRMSRAGHSTGRSLVLKPLGQLSFWGEGRFSVGAFVTCRSCGQEFPVLREAIAPCRGHK